MRFEFVLTIVRFIKMIFRRSYIKDFVREFIEPATEIVSLLRSAVESDAIDVAVKLTKSDWDDKLQKKILKGLATAIESLMDVKAWTESKRLSDTEKIQVFAEQLKQMPERARSAYYHKLAGTIAEQASKLAKKRTPRESEIDLFTSMNYSLGKVNEKS